MTNASIFGTMARVAVVVFLMWCNAATAQTNRILHYSETSGFDHGTRSSSLTMFQQMGLQHGFTVDDDQSGQAFNSISNLQQYDAIVFSNTSGQFLLDSTQKSHMVWYMNNGGGFVGIHAASDTYRHSTANGSNTGGWDWYAEMLGASVRENPNHVNGTPVYQINSLLAHPLLNNIPGVWQKAEEYYYWEGGYFDSMNIVLQMVEQTVGPNGMVNSYDSARAVTWYKLLPGGGRVFYTSLGHAVSNFTSDPIFYQLLENAVLWSGNMTGLSESASFSSQLVFPNPFREHVSIHQPDQLPATAVLFDACGKMVWFRELENSITTMSTSNLGSGIYLLKIFSPKGVSSQKMVRY